MIATVERPSYTAFVPERVPWELTLVPEAIMRLSEADAALGRPERGAPAA